MYRLIIIVATVVAVCVAYFATVALLHKKEVTDKVMHRRLVGKFPQTVLCYVVLTAVALMIVFPFLYALLLSFKTGSDVFGTNIFPEKFVIRNYKTVLSDSDIRLFGGLLNSILYALPPCLIGVMTSTMAAYALSRLHFKGRDQIFAVLFATICIPGVITLIPSYIMFAKLYGWVDSPLPLIIPGMCGSVTVIFFLRQFLLGLPKELDEAGIIDGLSKGGVFFRIIMPLSWPAMLAQFLLAFNAGYNDFMGPLLYIGSNKSLYTVQLTVYSMASANVKQMEKIMAACVITLLPSIVMFTFAQKYFLGSSISVEGLKG